MVLKLVTKHYMQYIFGLQVKLQTGKHKEFWLLQQLLVNLENVILGCDKVFKPTAFNMELRDSFFQEFSVTWLELACRVCAQWITLYATKCLQMCPSLAYLLGRARASPSWNSRRWPWFSRPLQHGQQQRTPKIQWQTVRMWFYSSVSGGHYEAIIQQGRSMNNARSEVLAVVWNFKNSAAR